MFVGHFAPALVAATQRKAPSLPVLFIGAQLVDWAFFGFVLAGIEHMRIVPGFTASNPMDLYDMPYTHSLAGSAVWAAGFAGLVYAMMRDKTAALIAFAVVLSHWVMDLIVHAPDLTLAGLPPKLGLGLWNLPSVEKPLEIGLTLGGLWLYARATGGLRAGIWGLGAILLLLQAIDWFGAKPTEVDAAMTLLAWFGYAVATLGAWWAARGEQRA